MKLVTSRKKHGRYVLKPNFKDECPFLMELFAADQDEQANVHWTSNIGPKEGSNVWISPWPNITYLWK